MALTYSTTIQDHVALRLANTTYANLPTVQKKAIDNEWSSGALAAGHAYDAYTHVRRYAAFIQAGGSDTAPDDWLPWLVSEIVYRALAHVNPDMMKEARAGRDEAARTALTTFTRGEHDETTSTEGLVFSHLNIRRSVLDTCVRLDPMLLPTPDKIDSAIRSELLRVWYAGDWYWRRRQVRLAIATDGTVAYTPEVSVDAVVSRRIYFDDETGAGTVMVGVGADEMAYLKSIGNDDGRPGYFRTTKSGGSLVWHFDRTPDTTYNARAEVLLKCPALTGTANIATALSEMDPEFHDVLRDVVVAKVVSDYGRREGRSMSDDARLRMANVLNAIDDVGLHDERSLEPEAARTVEEQLDAGYSPYGFGGTLGGST